MCGSLHEMLHVSGPFLLLSTFNLLAYSRYPSFKEVRLVPGKPELAFVEFEDENAAAVAKDTLDGFKLSQTVVMEVGFAKR